MEEYILVKRTWLEDVLEIGAQSIPTSFQCDNECSMRAIDGEWLSCIDCLQGQRPELFKLPDLTPDIAKALHHLENMEKILDNNQLERGKLVIKDWLKKLRGKLDV